MLTHIGEALTSVVSKASSELQNKDRPVAQASAFISPASNKTKLSEGDHRLYEPEIGNWSFKESIMHSLAKAVNVIAGGMTILKGELIKGGGALAITLGKIIQVEGDAESNPGKKIISSTTLGYKQNQTVAHTATSHVKYGSPSTHGVPTTPAHFTTPTVKKGFGPHRYPSQLDEIYVSEIAPSDNAEDIDSSDDISDENDDENYYETDSNEDNVTVDS